MFGRNFIQMSKEFSIKPNIVPRKLLNVEAIVIEHYYIFTRDYQIAVPNTHLTENESSFIMYPHCFIGISLH